MTEFEKALAEQKEWLLLLIATHQADTKQRLDRQFNESELQLDKAETALDKRLDLLNEFRAQAADESRKFALIDTLEAAKARISNLETQVARLYGGLAMVAFIGITNIIKIWTG